MAVEALTDKRIQGLRTDGKRIEIRDAKVRNLILRVTPAGVKSWSVQFRVKGRAGTQRQTLGTYPAIGIAAARLRALDVIKKLAEGRDPIGEAKAQAAAAARDGLTFSNLLDEYLERRRNVVSMPEIERELRKDAMPLLGDKRPADITAADIDDIIQAIVARGSPVMGRRMIMAIKALYNYVIFDAPSLAARYGITANPAALLGRRRRGSKSAIAASKPRQRLLSDDEIAAWWAAVDSSKMVQARRIALKLILVTSQRPGEVRQCRKAGLRLDGPEPLWTLTADETKAGRRHVVPLSDLAVRLFKEAIALSSDADLIFPDPERRSEAIANVTLPTAQANLFRNHLETMEPATAHDLRRTAATGMRRIGVAPHVVSQILNHARPDITGRVYDHWEGMPERRVALERWASWVEAIVRGERIVVPPLRGVA
jgi:integrase